MQQNCIQFSSSRGTKNPKKIHVIKPDLDFVLHFVLNGGEKKRWDGLSRLTFF